jgi:hypothetical protein
MRRPVRPVNGAIVDDLDALPTLPLPAQCSYMVRGKRQCKRFAETSARTVCPEHTPEVRTAVLLLLSCPAVHCATSSVASRTVCLRQHFHSHSTD